MERREFFKSAAGIGAGLVAATTAETAAPAAAAAATTKGRPKLGVAWYSYSRIINRCMSFEDCFADMYDIGATCFEFFPANIENYPNPSTKWIDYFFGLCEKYQLQPEEFAHNIDENIKRGPRMSDEEYVRYAVRDFKLANLLGFHTLRSRFVDSAGPGTGPTAGWEGRVAKLLPYAEKYDVIMQPEIKPMIKEKYVDDYIAFIEKHKTKRFGFNVDFSSFPIDNPDRGDRDNPPPAVWVPKAPAAPAPAAAAKPTAPQIRPHAKPEDLIPILKYCYTCHAKFNHMNENFEETTNDYKSVLGIMADHGWNGNLVSEYEGYHMDNRQHVQEQLRRQHIMMRRFFGYTMKKQPLIFKGGKVNG